MSDNNKGIPSWQRNQSSQGGLPASASEVKGSADNHTANIPNTSSSPIPAGQSSQALLSEQAVKFLQDPSVQDASLEEKTTFLESKGLPKADIEKVMRSITFENKESTPPPTASKQHIPPSSLPTRAQIPPTTPSPPSIPARDIPPIITYPEFLMHSHKPPPLITIERLRNAAYIAGGIAATIYGASKYVLTPMSEALTEARHEFAQHSIAHLNDFNSKLSEVVSRDPGPNDGAGAATNRDGDSMSETSADSDPTELFHRDYGTQTSSELDAAARETALVSTATSSTAADEVTEDVVAMHTARLARITALCAEYNTESTSEGETSQEITSVVKVLGDYLDEMAYSQTYTNDALTMYGASSAGPKKAEDEISRMRAEIRGIKGVLLSARNFPAIAAAGGGGSRRAMFPPVQAPAAAA